VSYIVGQSISVAVLVTQIDPVTGNAVVDGSGNPVRVDDASMALTIWKPDQTTSSPAITHLSLGVYTASFTPDVGGWWQYSFQGVGTAPGRGKKAIFISQVP